ncbi:MAG: hypothetical protein ACE5JM_05465, partial [Armatimonadota bacterium]
MSKYAVVQGAMAAWLGLLLMQPGCGVKEPPQPGVAPRPEPKSPAARFREVLGAAGNEYVDPASESGEEQAEVKFSELPAPVQKVANAIIAKHAEFDIEIDEEDEGIVYDVEAEADDNDWDVELWPDGRPFEIDSESKAGIVE